MAITPADIEKKTFSTALRGYDLDEVDDFLDEMVVAVRELEEELAQARSRIAELERDPSAVAAAAVTPAAGADESAVGRALIAAQQAADRMLDDARTDSDRMLKDARSEADQLLEGARSEADTFAKDRDQKKAEVEAEMAEMNELVAGVRTKLAVLATTVADKLDEMDAVVAGARTGEVDELGESSTAFDEGADESIDAAAEEEEAETASAEGFGDGEASVEESGVGEASFEGSADGEGAAEETGADDAGEAESERTGAEEPSEPEES